jgi:hypothetical protein
MSSSTDSSAAAMNAVQYSFRLGWRFAQLYHNPHRANRDIAASSGALPQHLPGVSELSDSVRAALLLGEIQHDLDSLCTDKSLGSSALDRVKTSMTALAAVMTGPADETGKRGQILETYTLLRLDLGAADAHSGTALDLGRMIGDTVLLPRPEQLAQGLLAAEKELPAEKQPAADVLLARYLQHQFGQYRLANFYAWLEDLHASFPAHAADTVKGSLQVWQGWIAENKGAAPGGQSEQLKRALGSQGERWRRLLSGEILAMDLLSEDDYRAAAADLFSRLRGMVGSFVRRFWPVIGVIAVATAGVIWAIVAFAAAGVATIVALIATAAGSLGVSWKTISSTLGKVASKAEDPLWDAEVTQALIVAATIAPQELDRKKILTMRTDAAALSRTPGPAALPSSAQAERPAQPAVPPAQPAVPPAQPETPGQTEAPGQTEPPGQAEPAPQAAPVSPAAAAESV